MCPGSAGTVLITMEGASERNGSERNIGDLRERLYGVVQKSGGAAENAPTPPRMPSLYATVPDAPRNRNRGGMGLWSSIAPPAWPASDVTTLR